MRSRSIFLLLSIACVAPAQLDTVQRGAAISIKVESFSQGQLALAGIVNKHHGGFADRRQMSSESGRHSGWTRVIVPKSELDALMVDLRSVGKVYGEKMTLTDQTSLHEDLGKRSERLKQHEQRLSNILTSRRGLRGSDLLYVQERLYRASTDQDSLLEQRDAIPLRSAKSSVVVDLFEPTPVKMEPRGPMGHVKAAFEGAFRGLAFGLLGLIGPLLNLILVAIVAWIAWLIFRRPIRNAVARLRPQLKRTAPPTQTEPPPA